MPSRTHILLTLPITLALVCRTLTLPFTPATPTVAPTATLDMNLLHFENQWVAFDYPAGLQLHQAGFETIIWYPYVDLGGKLVVGLGDERFFGFGNYYRSVRIMRQSLPPGADLTVIMAEAYEQRGVKHPWPLMEGALDANGPISIDGRDAIQKSYRIYSGEPAYDLRDIWIPVNDELYVVTIATEWTNPEDFAAFEVLADKLLRSLVINGK